MNKNSIEDRIIALTILDENFEGLTKEERAEKLADSLLLSVEELKSKGFWGRACARLQRKNFEQREEINELVKALDKIANEDFRGNRSSASIIAYNAVKVHRERQKEL